MYLNWKGPQGRETVDEVNRCHFETHAAMMREISRVQREYALIGMDVYPSRKACTGWNK